MTLAAADRNDIRGTVSSEADFRNDIYGGAKFNLIDKNLQQYGNNEIFSNQVRNIVFDTDNCG